ncbi:hypothetical protein AAL_05164 [Moelleriella libera RCEF 2490]|uniref:Uncharacterized protein n=1 Tax=Moelleriella libera RCEF 2490 TaxID=1081109 RepID=A0A168AQ51_9HYPO|nr:hypothetical protein AAL_05164 [Moelleriella libera RCEF 2490]
MNPSYNMPLPDNFAQDNDNGVVRNLRGRSVQYQSGVATGPTGKRVKRATDHAGLALPQGINNSMMQEATMPGALVLPMGFEQAPSNNADGFVAVNQHLNHQQQQLASQSHLFGNGLTGEGALLNNFIDGTTGLEESDSFDMAQEASMDLHHNQAPSFRGLTLEELHVPGAHFLSPNHQARVIEEFQRPLTRPPLLPENRVEELNAKQVFPDYIRGEDHPDPAFRLAAEEMNNAMALEMQRVDRERNNSAAKRSRRVKHENLTNASIRVVGDSMQVAWLRASLTALGGDPDAFYNISQDFITGYRESIYRERCEAEEMRKRERSRRDTQRRSELHRARTRKKQELNALATHHCSTETATSRPEGWVDRDYYELMPSERYNRPLLAEPAAPPPPIPVPNKPKTKKGQSGRAKCNTAVAGPSSSAPRRRVPVAPPPPEDRILEHPSPAFYLRPASVTSAPGRGVSVPFEGSYGSTPVYANAYPAVSGSSTKSRSNAKGGKGKDKSKKREFDEFIEEGEDEDKEYITVPQDPSWGGMGGVEN